MSSMGSLLLRLCVILYNLSCINGFMETLHEPAEYCESNDFNPVCSHSHDEVIVMMAATYGRMALGKCVTTDYGYVGCKADVLTHMDNECSGRRKCSIRIPDKELDESKPCPKEFKTYLNATYKCLQVEDSSCTMCMKSNFARLTLPSGYIASVVTEEDNNGCGSARCPWLIGVQPGQKINLTLYDFGRQSQEREFYVPDSCFRYAVIKEAAATRDTPICGGRDQRKSEVYTSVSNSIEIHVVSPEVFSNRGHFLLYYEAVGCPDLTPPKNSWLKREDDIMIVGCEGNEDTWRLKCKGTEWEGEIGECPLPDVSPQTRTISLPLGVLIAIVVGIALVIGVLILTVGVVCLKRQHREPRQRPETSYYVRARQDPEYHLEMVPGPHVDNKNINPGELTSKRPRPPPTRAKPVLMNPRENLYARRMQMESRPLPSIPNIPEASEDDGSRQNVQVYRTQSGREHYHYQPRIYMRPVPQSAPPHPPIAFPVSPPVVPNMPSASSGATGTGPPSRPSTAASGSISAGDPQYFVLDPDDLKERDEQEEEQARERRAARAANAEAQSSTVNPLQKSPEEENAENINKEVHLNNSCHEIPLRPTREGSQTRTTPNPNITNESNNTGNCSWP